MECHGKVPNPAQAEQDLAYEQALEAKRDELYGRLDAGYSRIEAMVQAGNPRIQEWEEFWRILLREYEMVCNELQRTLAY